MSHMTARFALPLIVFAAVLTFALSLSRWVFLPRLAGVPLHGEMLYGASLVRFYTDLHDRVRKLEEERNHLVLPGQDSLSQFLHRFRHSDRAFIPLMTVLARSAEQTVPDHPDAVFLESFTYTTEEQTITLTGDVRGVGPRSMTVLAEFIEALKRLPFVEAVEHQRFTREEDAAGAFHSPFTLLLRLRPSSTPQ